MANTEALDLRQFKGKLIKNGNCNFSIPEDVCYIGLYFSAHWCPPCKAFTPKLAQHYKLIPQDQDHKTEMIFLSSDQTEDDFNKYFSEMPWAALSFDESDIRDSLSEKYDVKGIPCLVIVNNKGELVTKEGRQVVACGSLEWKL